MLRGQAWGEGTAGSAGWGEGARCRGRRQQAGLRPRLSLAETWGPRQGGGKELGACGDSWAGESTVCQGDEEKPGALGQLGHTLGARKKLQGSLGATALEIREDSCKGPGCPVQGFSARWDPLRSHKAPSSETHTSYSLNGSAAI